MENLVNVEELESTQEFVAPYTSTRQFNQPILIGGSKLKFTPRTYKNNSEDYLDTNEVIESFRKFEDTFQTLNVNSLADVKLISVENNGYLFSVINSDGVEQMAFIPTLTDIDKEDVTEEAVAKSKKSLALKMLFKLLKIPFEFAIKNPSKIRTELIEHWAKYLPESGDNPIPLTMVVNKNAYELTTSDGTRHNVVEILSIYRVKAVPASDGVRPQFYEIDKQIPLFSKAIPVVEQLIKDTIPGAEPRIKQVEYGFTNENASQHCVRFVVPNSKLSELQQIESSNDEWHNSAKDYYIMYTLRSDFSNSVDAFKTTLDVGLYRLVCSNGLTVPMDSSVYERMKQTYIDNGLQELSFALDSDDERLQRRKENCVKSLEYKFNTMFHKNKFSFSLDNEAFNTNTIDGNIREVLRLIGDVDSLVSTVIRPLDTELPKVSNLDFVKTLDQVAKRSKISPRITNAIAVEYLSERVPDSEGNLPSTEPLKIRKPIDIVNMVTFLAQSSKDSFSQSKLEGSAIQFANDIQNQLLGTAQEDTELLDKYMNLVIH